MYKSVKNYTIDFSKLKHTTHLHKPHYGLACFNNCSLPVDKQHLIAISLLPHLPAPAKYLWVPQVSGQAASHCYLTAKTAQNKMSSSGKEQRTRKV